MKVMGAKSIYSNAGSDKTVKIPKNMLAVIKGDPNISSVKISDLNNASITTGKVSVDLTDTSGNVTNVLVDIPTGDQAVSAIVSNFNSALSSYGITFSASDGAISYTNAGSYTMEFSPTGTTSNFLAETGLATSTTSSLLNEVVTLQDMINYNDPNAISLKSTAIDENGIIVATYNDGSVLTQYVDEAQTLQWKYTTPEGVTISGADVTAEGSAITNSNFALELATMVNQEGLVSLNNNLWEWGPDVGEIYYGIAGEMAFGSIESGGYEESNVDIAVELSNMIMAQRMIQMNSRVFSTASDVMQTLAYLGQ